MASKAPTTQNSHSHLYISALAFTPSQSLVSKYYRQDFENLLRVVEEKPDESFSALRLSFLAEPGSELLCIVISPDGKRIITGSSEGSIEIWDTNTGMLIETLRNRTYDGSVRCMALTKNGKRLVVGLSNSYV